jgi:hypothetical protein
MSFKKANDNKGLNEQNRVAEDALSKEQKAIISGVNCGIAKQGVVERISGDCEKVIDNKEKYQNSAIVFGRDRPRAISSGYGGRGDTQSDMIDIVVGMQGYNLGNTPKDNPTQYVEPDFALDAARIYICQKTDIDENFVLAPGSQGSPGLESSKRQPRSAIALKADDIRIVARQGIKLVTGTDNRNSQGGKIFGFGGIDLIAGNDAKGVQPIVKGDNLLECMSKILNMIQDLKGALEAFRLNQSILNAAIQSHTHVSPFQGQQVLSSIPVMQAGFNNQIKDMTNVFESVKNVTKNLENMQKNYLSPAGERYINSRFNNTN